jgi:excinuclease ABC subunit B
MRSMLIEDSGRLMLIDTGIGDKQSEKFFSHYYLHGNDSLHGNLQKLGFHADDITDAMHKAIDETNRRRDIQIAYNKEHGIDPKPLIKKISDVNDMLAKEDVDTQTLLGTGYRNADKAGNSHLGVPHTSKEESGRRHEEILKAGLPAQDLADLIRQLSEQMHTAAEQLQFELAARLRDEIRDLKKELRQMTEASK